MPTPSNNNTLQSSSVASIERLAHSTCPPESGRLEGWSGHPQLIMPHDVVASGSATSQRTFPDTDITVSGDMELARAEPSQTKEDMDRQETEQTQEQVASNAPSPSSTTMESKDNEPLSSAEPSSVMGLTYSTSRSFAFSNVRVSITRLGKNPLYE